MRIMSAPCAHHDSENYGNSVRQRTIMTAAAVLVSALTLPLASAYTPKARLLSNFRQPASDAVLACPSTKAPLQNENTVISSVVRSFKVSAEGVRYPANEVYTDLLPTSGKTAGSTLAPEQLLDEVREAWASRTKTQLFRSPFTAYLYERGWRQNFERAGFPGIDEEFAEVQTFFAPAQGGVVVDMSCGSGLMTRRLATCDFGRLLALDYSEAMLAETGRRLAGKPGQGGSTGSCALGT